MYRNKLKVFESSQKDYLCFVGLNQSYSILFCIFSVFSENKPGTFMVKFNDEYVGQIVDAWKYCK